MRFHGAQVMSYGNITLSETQVQCPHSSDLTDPAVRVAIRGPGPCTCSSFCLFSLNKGAGAGLRIWEDLGWGATLSFPLVMTASFWL